MLTEVVDGGTGARLRYAYGITAEMGGKTGTTNFHSDGWFMGFTPELVTGVWVGGEERFIHFVSTAMGQGAEAALPILGLFMKSVYADNQLPYNQSTKFVFPKDFRECGDELGPIDRTLEISDPDFARSSKIPSSSSSEYGILA